jgi:hypothetical protein
VPTVKNQKSPVLEPYVRRIAWKIFHLEDNELTTVVHVRKSPQFDIYIGRSFLEFSQSDWHNPFRLGYDGNRKVVLEKYRRYVLSMPNLVVRLPELRGKTLGCWCKPKYLCHGDVLAFLAELDHVDERSGEAKFSYLGRPSPVPGY